MHLYFVQSHNLILVFHLIAGFEIAGWCIFVKREIFGIMGKLDENFTFTAADYDYGNILGAPI